MINAAKANQAKRRITEHMCNDQRCFGPATHRIMVTWASGGENVIDFACDVDLSALVTEWRDHYESDTTPDALGVWAERIER